jgi:hypothetical protein
VIVKTFPNISANLTGPKYPLYCKYQLKPWQGSIDNIWNTQQPTDDAYISTYHDFLQTEYARTNLSDHSADLERAEYYKRTIQTMMMKTTMNIKQITVRTSGCSLVQ